MFKHFLLTAAALMIGIAASAQINLSLKNVKVSDAITALNRSQGYSVTVNSADLDLNRVVSVNAAGASINEVLDQIFAGQQVSYKISGKSISVVKAAPRVVSNAITGIVTDEAGEPLIGAGVQVKGTRQGFITDLDGKFSLKDVQYPATLVVSYIGYTDQEVPVSGKEGSIRVVFTNSMNVLNEVVVVGYGTQKRINVTGAVGVIDGKELAQRPVTNAAQALQGADPSLVLTQGNGSVEGNQYSVNIRGTMSINGGSPLILIDGIEGSLTQVNPNDIESVSVLKDASACAIYGAKASAGVVLINTKNGNSGKAQVTYTGRFSVTQSTTSTDFITSSYDYITLCNEFYNYLKGYGAYTYSDAQIQMMYDRRNDVTENPERPWVIPDETGTYTYVYLGNYDWYNFLFKKNRPETEHNVSVRGGNDKVKYYASGRFLNKEGQFNSAGEDIYNAFSFRAKVDAKVTDWLDYNTAVSFENMKYSYGGFWELDGSDGHQSSGILFNLTQNVGPMYTPYNPDGTINIQPGFMADATSPLFSGRGGVFMDARNRNLHDNNYLTLTNRLTFKVAKGLNFIADYTYRRRDKQETYRSYPTANCYDNANRRMYLKEGLDPGFFANGSVYDFYRENRYYQDGHVANAYFKFDRSFGDHNVAATLGGNFEMYRSSSLTLQQNANPSDALSFISLISDDETGVNNITTASESVTAHRTLGFFFRANYDYKGKYLFEVSGRADGSSRFPTGLRWGFFPSASAGWRISQEPFWEPLKPVWNRAKIRYSYGSLGNQQVSDYYYLQSISTAQGAYTFNGSSKATYAKAEAPVSSAITWETVITNNLGFDFGFFKDRLNLTADFYIRDTKNMLTKAKTLPAVYGEAAPKTNAADLRTKGYEIILGWKDTFSLLGKNASYGVTASLGDSKSVITRFDNPEKSLKDHYVGEVLGDIWGYTTSGLFASDEEAAEYALAVNDKNVNKGVYGGKAPNNHLMAGDIRFNDLDGSGVIDNGNNTAANSGDLRIIGNSIPRYNYSFKGDFSWNGFDLSVFLQGVGKINWMPNYNCIYFWNTYSYQRPTFIPKDFESRCWSSEEGADNSNAVFPRRRGRICNSGNIVTSDYFLQDASYLRLKNLTIGYSLPLKTKSVEKVRFYFSGENLYFWSPMKKYTSAVDPEIATTSAADDCMYPFPRTFSLGVDITF